MKFQTNVTYTDPASAIPACHYRVSISPGEPGYWAATIEPLAGESPATTRKLPSRYGTPEQVLRQVVGSLDQEHSDLEKHADAVQLAEPLTAKYRSYALENCNL